MILCYHKIDLESHSHFWVSADAFDRQLADLQAFEVVTLDDYDPGDPRHVVITFDGVYSGVAAYALPLLRKWGYPFELFVIGDWIGRENSFDQHVEPAARFASLDELDELVAGGGRVQWHTRSHARLAGLDGEQLAAELTPPDGLAERYGGRHLRWFAYPHGEHAPAAQAGVRDRFDGAVSVVQGAAEDRYALPRREIAEPDVLSRSTVSLVIANYNYGRFLPEAVDSVLRQTRPPDELVIIDDGSDDDSATLLDRYEAVATRIIRNERNLGIVPTFRLAVEHTSGEYVAFLGADNRLRSDYIERAKAALDAHPDAAVAYTDVALFGPRSHVLAQQVGAHPTLADDVYIWRQPDPTPERIARLADENFIHGSSMYRRADYERAGGYRSGDGPEDHDLFTRMVLDNRRGAVRVDQPVLEYRQHSGEQANTLLSAQLQVAYWMGEARRAIGETAQLHGHIAGLAAEREALHARLAELAAENDRLRERGTAELAELRRRAATLAAIEAGGWWRLRARLLPLLRVPRQVRRAWRARR